MSCRCRRVRARVVTYLVAAALDAAARAIARADGIYRQVWCLLAKKNTSRPTIALRGRDRPQERALSQPRVMCLHFVAAAPGGAACAVARADFIYRQSRCVLANPVATRTSAGLFGNRCQARAALEPPEGPRDAVVVVVALRRHAVLPYKKVVVVGELVH